MRHNLPPTKPSTSTNCANENGITSAASVLVSDIDEQMDNDTRPPFATADLAAWFEGVQSDTNSSSRIASFMRGYKELESVCTPYIHVHPSETNSTLRYSAPGESDSLSTDRIAKEYDALSILSPLSAESAHYRNEKYRMELGKGPNKSNESGDSSVQTTIEIHPMQSLASQNQNGMDAVAPNTTVSASLRVQTETGPSSSSSIFSSLASYIPSPIHSVMQAASQNMPTFAKIPTFRELSQSRASTNTVTSPQPVNSPTATIGRSSQLQVRADRHVPFGKQDSKILKQQQDLDVSRIASECDQSSTYWTLYDLLLLLHHFLYPKTSERSQRSRRINIETTRSVTSTQGAVDNEPSNEGEGSSGKLTPSQSLRMVLNDQHLRKDSMHDNADGHGDLKTTSVDIIEDSDEIPQEKVFMKIYLQQLECHVRAHATNKVLQQELESLREKNSKLEERVATLETQLDEEKRRVRNETRHAQRWKQVYLESTLHKLPTPTLEQDMNLLMKDSRFLATHVRSPRNRLHPFPLRKAMTPGPNGSPSTPQSLYLRSKFTDLSNTLSSFSRASLPSLSSFTLPSFSSLPLRLFGRNGQSYPFPAGSVSPSPPSPRITVPPSPGLWPTKPKIRRKRQKRAFRSGSLLEPISPVDLSTAKAESVSSSATAAPTEQVPTANAANDPRGLPIAASVSACVTNTPNKAKSSLSDFLQSFLTTSSDTGKSPAVAPFSREQSTSSSVTPYPSIPISRDVSTDTSREASPHPVIIDSADVKAVSTSLLSTPVSSSLKPVLAPVPLPSSERKEDNSDAAVSPSKYSPPVYPRTPLSIRPLRALEIPAIESMDIDASENERRPSGRRARGRGGSGDGDSSADAQRKVAFSEGEASGEESDGESEGSLESEGTLSYWVVSDDESGSSNESDDEESVASVSSASTYTDIVAGEEMGTATSIVDGHPTVVSQVKRIVRVVQQGRKEEFGVDRVSLDKLSASISNSTVSQCQDSDLRSASASKEFHSQSVSSPQQVSYSTPLPADGDVAAAGEKYFSVDATTTEAIGRTMMATLSRDSLPFGTVSLPTVETTANASTSADSNGPPPPSVRPTSIPARQVRQSKTGRERTPSFYSFPPVSPLSPLSLSSGVRTGTSTRSKRRKRVLKTERMRARTAPEHTMNVEEEIRQQAQQRDIYRVIHDFYGRSEHDKIPGDKTPLNDLVLRSLLVLTRFLSTRQIKHSRSDSQVSSKQKTGSAPPVDSSESGTTASVPAVIGLSPSFASIAGSSVPSASHSQVGQGVEGLSDVELRKLVVENSMPLRWTTLLQFLDRLRLGIIEQADREYYAMTNAEKEILSLSTEQEKQLYWDDVESYCRAHSLVPDESLEDESGKSSLTRKNAKYELPPIPKYPTGNSLHNGASDSSLPPALKHLTPLLMCPVDKNLDPMQSAERASLLALLAMFIGRDPQKTPQKALGVSEENEESLGAGTGTELVRNTSDNQAQEESVSNCDESTGDVQMQDTMFKSSEYEILSGNTIQSMPANRGTALKARPFPCRNFPAIHPGRFAVTYKPSRGVRILCLDGGGIRGLFMLSCLKRIESLTGRRIHELFDLICGTSTGGMLAMSLTIQRTLEECALQYADIRNSFAYQSPLWAEVRRMITGTSHSTEIAEGVIKSFYPAIKLSELPPNPKVFAIATLVDTTPMQPYLFRSYEHEANTSTLPIPASFPLPTQATARKSTDAGARPKTPMHPTNKSAEELFTSPYAFFRTPLEALPGTNEALIYEAVRATTSAPTFYLPARIGNHTFCDGALQANNPSLVALAEASALWPGAPIDCMVSLGTGLPTSKLFQPPQGPAGVLQWVKSACECAVAAGVAHAVASCLFHNGMFTGDLGAVRRKKFLNKPIQSGRVSGGMVDDANNEEARQRYFRYDAIGIGDFEIGELRVETLGEMLELGERFVQHQDASFKELAKSLGYENPGVYTGP